MSEAIDLQQWVHRTETLSDEATLVPALALGATLDVNEEIREGAPLPPLWHWLYFLPRAPRSEIGPDGHPKRGGFLPPVTLPRRMWAGSRLEWAGTLRIGDAIARKSVIESVEEKSGKSGKLVFVKVRHEIGKRGGDVAVREWQDIVYRDAAAGGTAAPAASPAPAVADAPAAPWTRHWTPDPVLLFRFSALTFNGHRIHYDRPYAMQEEGYPGLVVHGPLLAMLMMQLARERAPGRAVRAFQFRGSSPVIDTGGFEVCGIPGDGNAAELFVRTDGGVKSTQGSITFS